MTELDALIRAKLDTMCHDLSFQQARDPALLMYAIRAVLDEHALDDPLWPDADGKLERVGPPGTTCSACVADPYWIGTEKSEMAEDPCPTKRAIAKALGIEVSA